MRVLFLDVDGVLNPHGTGWQMGRGPMHLVPELCAHLERVVSRAKAVIVLSSAWRYATEDSEVGPAEFSLAMFERWLTDRGCPSAEVIGRTPLGSELSLPLVPIPGHATARMYAGEVRGHEIACWLEGRDDVDSFAIVDDSADMAHLEHRLVRTASDRGLEDEHVDRLVALLTEDA